MERVIDCIVDQKVDGVCILSNFSEQFLIDDEIRGIPPFPNRLVCFDSNILHRATTFRDKFRFTLALKYGDL